MSNEKKTQMQDLLKKMTTLFDKASKVETVRLRDDLLATLTTWGLPFSSTNKIKQNSIGSRLLVAVWVYSR